MNINIATVIISLIPAILIALISFYFFKLHIDNDDKRRKFLLRQENQKQSLPLRLQAYERLALFLERISPNKLLLRVAPLNNDKKEYESLLISTIEQELDHNLTQQIYVSDECWNVIKAAKNGTIALIRKINMNKEVDSANKLRESILTILVEKDSPSDIALASIKAEVSDIF